MALGPWSSCQRLPQPSRHVSARVGLLGAGCFLQGPGGALLSANRDLHPPQAAAGLEPPSGATRCRDSPGSRSRVRRAPRGAAGSRWRWSVVLSYSVVLPPPGYPGESLRAQSGRANQRFPKEF